MRILLLKIPELSTDKAAAFIVPAGKYVPMVGPRKEQEGEEGFKGTYEGTEDKQSSSKTDGKEAGIRGPTESPGYCENPSTTTESANEICGCTEEKSNWSCWVPRTKGGTEKEGDGEKSMEADMSLSISSCESNMMEILLLLLVLLLMVLVVVVLVAVGIGPAAVVSVVPLLLR